MFGRRKRPDADRRARAITIPASFGSLMTSLVAIHRSATIPRHKLALGQRLPTCSRGRGRCVHLVGLIGLILFAVPTATAADFDEARNAYYSGDYDRCVELTRAEVERGIWNDFWSRQLMQALMAQGRHEDACAVYEEVVVKFGKSIPLRMLAARAYRFSGDSETARRLLDEIPQLVDRAPWQYSDRENLLAIGRYLLERGVDAREVLETYYDRVLRSDGKYVAAHVAIAELALDKADYQEAVKSLDKALELRPEDPHVHYLLSRAWSASDRKKANAYLNAALDLNPVHADSLLLHARNLIDAEEYAAALAVVEEVFEINPDHSTGWALRAAIAHLQGNYREEGEYRARALSTWKTNAEVDYVIGTTLSKHYRFSEGVLYQRRALKLNSNFLPAKFQLAQDLLRVGQDEEGWSVVDEVSQTDKYNVVAYNLKTLQARLRNFTTLEAPGLIVRMDTREAAIYGPQVLGLLQAAHRQLTDKYEHELERPVTVEIFPQQSDFAIRTFGLPGGAGFLGVCFGSLITANSPASQGDQPSNWESVLWHEYCHVVTLQKTNNRMPRWLSEGISVYEELQRDPSWGQSLNPTYKDMLLGEDFVPLSQLSGAFLKPKSALHLQFAYFESMLAVRYLVERHGRPRLLRLLDDLGLGRTMEEAFAERYGDQAALDEDFQKFIRELASEFLPETEFDADVIPQRASPEELEQWLDDHPASYPGWQRLARLRIERRDWPAAEKAAQRLLELYPRDAAPGGALDMLAGIARGQEDLSAERQYLEQIVQASSDHLPALRRLLANCRKAQDWPGLAQAARRLLAVQPLLPDGHEGLALALRQQDRLADAAGSLRALQELEPMDPAGLHFSLAESLAASNKLEQARLEVLRALEYSPRYREAQRLLVDLYQRRNPTVSIPVNPPDRGRPPRIPRP